MTQINRTEILPTMQKVVAAVLLMNDATKPEAAKRYLLQAIEEAKKLENSC